MITILAFFLTCSLQACYFNHDNAHVSVRYFFCKCTEKNIIDSDGTTRGSVYPENPASQIFKMLIIRED